MEALCSGSSQILPYETLFPDLNPFCYGKIVSLSTVLTWVLWVLLVNSGTWGSRGNLHTCNQLVRSMGGLGTPELGVGVWSEGSLVGHMPLTCEVWPNSRQLVTEWHCTDPSVSSCLENAALLLPLLEHLTLDGHTSWLRCQLSGEYRRSSIAASHPGTFHLFPCFWS